MPVEELANNDRPQIEKIKDVEPIIPQDSLLRQKPSEETIKLLSKRCDVEKVPYGHINLRVMRECEEYGIKFLIIVEGDKRKLFRVRSEDNLLMDTFKDDRDLNSFLVTIRDIAQFAKRSKAAWLTVYEVMKNDLNVTDSDVKMMKGDGNGRQSDESTKGC
jgi:hypothetical protein